MQSFLKWTQKTFPVKKNEKLDFIKIKNFYSSEGTNKIIKKKATDWEKISGIRISDKGV